jgi:RNA polymerase sigma factor (sigma-70 family)
MQDGSDASLGDRFRTGDHDAFAELHRQAAPGIHDFVFRMVRDRAAAEDLTQATFLRAYERRSSLGDSERVTGWLYAIARNLALDHLRRRRPVTTLEETTMPAADLASPSQDPEQAAMANEAVQLVWDAAASLEARQAAVLDLSLRHGLGPTDIAAALETSPEHAAVLVNRARSALGGAVRHLAVARRRGRCERLDALVPAGLRQLTPAQRKTVDHHLRRCETCQDTAAVLTAPDALYAATPLLALPAALRLAPDLGGAGRAPQLGDHARPPPSANAARATGGAPASNAVVVLLVVGTALIVAVAATVLAVRARTSDDVSAPPTTTTAFGATGSGGSSSSGSSAPTASGAHGRPAGPSSTAPLVTNGTGASALLSLDGIIVATDGCDVAMFQAAPDPGDSLFLLGTAHLDGDRFTLDGTSDTFTGELHEDGVFHLETHTGASSDSSIDARIGPDGKVTGVWSDVFLGDCVLHAEIRSGDSPTIAALTS